MNKAFLLLGSNMGNKTENIQQALDNISQASVDIFLRSSLYETEPWGVKEQATFLNQVISVETTMQAHDLLSIILDIEKKLGRKRIVKWGERIIDIDIIYFNNDIIVTKDLKVPHPEIQNRKFTLVPLVEIAPDYLHPVLNIKNEELLKRCSDVSVVKKYSMN